MTKKRFDYIDIAKGLGILMVVWAHIMLIGWTHKMIYAFHMPLFFFLSGMLFQRDKYSSFGSFFVRRAKRLLVPYVIYSVVTWGFWAAFRYVRHDEVGSYLMPLLQTVISQGSGEFMVHNSALWFIPCLFLVEIIYFFISKAGRLWSLIISFALSTISFLMGNQFGADYWFTPFWNADAALIAMPFYVVGNILIAQSGHHAITNTIKNNWAIYLALELVLTVVLYWSAMAFGECSMGSSSYQCAAWIFIPRAFLGIAWLVIFSILLSMIQRRNVIVSIVTKHTKWAGVSSLDIMCLHIPLKGFCMILVAYLLHTSVDIVADSYSLSFASFTLTMIASWVIISLINRFLRSK